MPPKRKAKPQAPPKPRTNYQRRKGTAEANKAAQAETDAQDSADKNVDLESISTKDEIRLAEAPKDAAENGSQSDAKDEDYESVAKAAVAEASSGKPSSPKRKNDSYETPEEVSPLKKLKPTHGPPLSKKSSKTPSPPPLKKSNKTLSPAPLKKPNKTPSPSPLKESEESSSPLLITAPGDQSKDRPHEDTKSQSGLSEPRDPSPVSPKRKRSSEDGVGEETPAKKAKETPAPQTPTKGKKAERSNGSGKKPFVPSPPREPATVEEKERWQGFCEIESDPAFFSVMVREFGAKSVTVKEAISLDEEILFMMPQPIFGFVLLFRAREVEPFKEEQSCPRKVWFANQMPAQNSCATLAMLNILLNLPERVDIGEHLRQFKDFTNDFTPYARGEALSSFEFVKRIHNSFAKKMDMLQDDTHLAYKASRGHGASRRKSIDTINTVQSEEYFEDNAHHFIAFLPADGKVWKLDGMNAFPTNLGTIDDDQGRNWISIATHTMRNVMASGGDNEYSIVALCQQPMTTLHLNMIQSKLALNLVHRHLNALTSEWSAFAASVEPSPTLLSVCGVSQEALNAATLDPEEEERIDRDAHNLAALLERRENLISDLNEAQVKFYQAADDIEKENIKAEERRWDYGPFIKRWLEMLAENGHLEQNMDKFQERRR